MKAERWQRIEELYHSALSLTADARWKYLEDACSGDEGLRVEVESLLRHGERSGSILESPALAVVAQQLARESSEEKLLQAGTTISHYRIHEAIGRGGMGMVYKAEDLKLRRLVALKLLPETLSGNDHSLRRFEREAQAASALNHPNICTIYEIDEARGLHFIAIEFLDGETLKDRIARGLLPAGETATIAIEICRALEAAHAAGIIHRDIKPANIFLTRSGVAKVLDFGVAKRMGQGLAQEKEARRAEMIAIDGELTVTGVTVGTVAYMSPEQTRGESVDSRADLFSLGSVLFEMLTGMRPFCGESIAEIFHAIQEQAPNEKLAQRIPVALARIVSKALEKKREARYQRAEDLRLELEHFSVRVTAVQRRVPRIVAAVLGLALLAGIALGAWKGTHRGGAASIRSLAVLPLANLTGDPSQEYFADGMTDALITNLTKVGSLRVISRASAMHYKGAEKALPEIAKELNVNAVIEGSVLRSGNRVRISTQLVDPIRDQNLWAQDYERDWQDVLRLQSEVAWDVVKQIQVKLTPEERQRVAQYGRCAPNAHDLYLQGMYHWFKADPDEYERARDYFEQARNADPNCAEGYAGLGYYYSIAADEGILTPAEGWPKARLNAQKAIDLDPNVGSSYLTLSGAAFMYDWNFTRGVQEVKKALVLSPDWADTHREYAILLSILGKPKEAIAEAKKALETDPFSPSIRASVGWQYYYARRWDEAIDQFELTLQMDTRFLAAHEGLVKCYQQKGMEAKAIQQLTLELQLSDANDLANQLQKTYRSAGYKSAVHTFYRSKLVQYQQAAKEAYIQPLIFANLYSLLHEKDEAFKWLEKAYQERASKLTDLKLDPDYDNIRSDPRFATLVNKIGLP